MIPIILGIVAGLATAAIAITIWCLWRNHCNQDCNNEETALNVRRSMIEQQKVELEERYNKVKEECKQLDEIWKTNCAAYAAKNAGLADEYSARLRKEEERLRSRIAENQKREKESEEKMREKIAQYDAELKENEEKVAQYNAELKIVEGRFKDIKQRFEVWKGKSVVEGRGILGIRSAERRAALVALEEKYDGESNAIEERLRNMRAKEEALLDENMKRANVDLSGKVVLSENAIRDLKIIWEFCDKGMLPATVITPLYKAAYTAYIQKPLGALRAVNKCGIYRIWNVVTGMSYVGQAINIGERWAEHVKCGVKMDKGNGVLYDAMWEYGIWNFRFEVVEEVGREKLNEREKFYIEYWNCKDKGYNSTKGNGK